MPKTILPTLLLTALPLVGCTGASEGGIAEGHRLITGRAFSAAVDDAGSRRALQLVAVFAQEECGDEEVRIGTAGNAEICAQFGEPFDPGAQGRLQTHCDQTVNLVVQTLGASGGQAPGEVLAVLGFPSGRSGGGTTTLLAREEDCRDTTRLATNILDLGEFSVPGVAGEEGPALVVVGGPEGGQNPLATVDTDQDLTPNVGDADDDGDDVEDPDDDDADGDGVDDELQQFSSDWI